MSKFNNNEIYFANWSGGGVLDKYDISKNIYSLAFYSQKGYNAFARSIKVKFCDMENRKKYFFWF